MKKNVKVSDAEVKSTLDQFKDHPQLSKLPKKDQEKQIRDYLEERNKQGVIDGIISAGQAKGEFAVSYSKPEEPKYKLTITDNDVVRFGPEPGDIEPKGCKGDDCQITIVEYSEFQCPFCSRVMPAVKKILTDYKGKVRWIMRDFPLSFHDRAKPASVAAHCSAEQGKFWFMYEHLFNNQRALSDADFEKYAGQIKGLDMTKWKACVKDPQKQLAKIDQNIDSGMKLGVSGTPAFVIGSTVAKNTIEGVRLSGALPFEEFKRSIDEILAKNKKG